MNKVIKLPRLFDEKLKNSNLYDEVLRTLKKITPLLDNQSPLFPEYTDHSSSHIQEVLNAAANLITAESYDLMSEEDIYVLVLAICLHDSAMTFSWNDLRVILKEDRYNGSVFGYNEDEELDWICLWKEFESEFSNYTHDELTDIIGDKIDVDENISDYFPSIDDVDLKLSQLKVAGEFVRRHHARLAHVVANFGFPCVNDVEVFDNKNTYLNDLSGLVARSHHESLRAMHDRLDNDKRMSYLKCHLIFLMAIVRIADLMQITSDRTPLITFKSKTFWSSFSENEWKKHLKVLGIKDFPIDPACLTFEIAPDLDSVQRLFSIRSLLNYFQTELDLVWASLGEAYRESALSGLKIKYRRVSSELTSKNFLNRLPFEDQPASFKVDLSLIKKLIKPLYGDLPEVGIRELLQNGLDSVRERNYIEPSCDYKVNVKLYKESEDSYIEISDDGCGMDEKTINNYFLNIGSSFRSSKQWSSEFSVENKSNVSRSGRFGIGMLAGFILGDAIQVTTKKYTLGGNDKALMFSFTLEGKMIQLNRIPAKTVNTGTVIKIKLKAEVDERLRQNPQIWQWYFRLDKDYQEVEYFIDSESKTNSIQTPNDYWRPVPSLDDIYRDFRWGSNNIAGISNNMLFVNNLKISVSAGDSTKYSKTLDNYDHQKKMWGFNILFPPVALEDPDLNLPLNLERNGFSEEEFHFAEILYDEVITSYIDAVESYSNEVYNIDLQRSTLNTLFYGLTRDSVSQQLIRSQIGLWGMHEKGFIFADLALIQNAEVEQIFLISPSIESNNILKDIPSNSVVFKFDNDQFVTKYNRNGTIYKEQTILSFFNSNGFLKAIFGLESGVISEKENYTLTINKNRLDDIKLSDYECANNIKKGFGERAVSFSISEANEHVDFDLKNNDFVITINIKDFARSEVNNQFTKRWLKELSSPFLNNQTKRK